MVLVSGSIGGRNTAARKLAEWTKSVESDKPKKREIGTQKGNI
jgi:hypothetical protein